MTTIRDGSRTLNLDAVVYFDWTWHSFDIADLGRPVAAVRLTMVNGAVIDILDNGLAHQIWLKACRAQIG